MLLPIPVCYTSPSNAPLGPLVSSISLCQEEGMIVSHQHPRSRLKGEHWWWWFHVGVIFISLQTQTNPCSSFIGPQFHITSDFILCVMFLLCSLVTPINWAALLQWPRTVAALFIIALAPCACDFKVSAVILQLYSSVLWFYSRFIDSLLYTKQFCVKTFSYINYCSNRYCSIQLRKAELKCQGKVIWLLPAETAINQSSRLARQSRTRLEALQSTYNSCGLWLDVAISMVLPSVL